MENEKEKDFAELLSANHGRIFGCIYSLVLNMHDTEDLYQKTAVILWEKFDEFERGTDFGSWAWKVARYCVMNYIRAKGRSKVVFSEPLLNAMLETHQTIATGETLARSSALGKCLERLNRSDRQLITDCYDSEISIKDVAHRDGRTTNAVYLALGRIRASLLTCIEHRLISESNA